MDDTTALQLIDSYALPAAGKSYLRECIRSGPSRSVFGGGTRSVVGAHFSIKLQETRQFESRASEAAVLLMLDADSRVLSYYTQLPKVEFPSKNAAGKNYVQRYTPDVLILRRDKPEIGEIKTGQDLIKLSRERPHHWIYESETEARFEPPERYFNSLGLDYTVINSSLIPPVLVENTKLLLRVVHELEDTTAELHDRVRSVLAEHAWMSIGELQDQLQLTRADEILHLIAKGFVFSDPERQKLCSPESILSLSPMVLKNAIDQRTLPSGPVLSGYRGPTLLEAEKAVERIELAKGGHCRQARRMRQKIRDGAAEGMTPFESLLPRITDRGNRNKRLAKDQEEFLMQHQENHILSGKKESIWFAYDCYKNAVTNADHPFPPVSAMTYYKYARRLNRQTIATAIHGKKAGNAVSRSVNPEHATPAATRAFQRGLVDHTLLPILLVVAMNLKCAIVRRPWLSSLVDEYSGATLAQWLSFGNPSRESICMLLRMCILRHGRIPEEIHSDRGSDFTSLHAQATMAYFGVTRQYSPAGSPKFNSQAERHFSETQKGLVSKLPGNIIEHNDRKTDRDHHPKTKAIFEPVSFYQLVFNYAEDYNNGVHGSHEAQPNYLLSRSLRRINSSGIKVSLNKDAYLATCVPVDSNWGPRARRSLLIDGRHYYSQCLTPETRKKDLCIRFDPWNCEMIYIQKQGKWYSAMRRTGYTTFTGSDISKQLGDSLRVMMCRRDRDLLKASQKQETAKLIEDAIDRAKTTQIATTLAEVDHEVAARGELQKKFACLSKSQKAPTVVEWD